MPAFQPDEVDTMARALDMATAGLTGVDLRLREAIAARIVAAAQVSGATDPAKLCEVALSSSPLVA
jgi:hypothetical protein